jgi:hypothetical protein
LPNGKKLVTLRGAATYIMKLPKAEHDAKEWQAAMEALLLVAESGGPTMFARIGVMRALNAGKPSHTSCRAASPARLTRSFDESASKAAVNHRYSSNPLATCTKSVST